MLLFIGEERFMGKNNLKINRMIQIDKNTSLTPSQASALTSDIVWIEERSVLLADGTQQKVLVPQLYLAQGQS